MICFYFNSKHSFHSTCLSLKIYGLDNSAKMPLQFNSHLLCNFSSQSMFGGNINYNKNHALILISLFLTEGLFPHLLPRVGADKPNQCHFPHVDLVHAASLLLACKYLKQSTCNDMCINIYIHLLRTEEQTHNFF